VFQPGPPAYVLSSGRQFGVTMVTACLEENCYGSAFMQRLTCAVSDARENRALAANDGGVLCILLTDKEAIGAVRALGAT
jgi:hypothetical protein